MTRTGWKPLWFASLIVIGAASLAACGGGGGGGSAIQPPGPVEPVDPPVEPVDPVDPPPVDPAEPPGPVEPVDPPVEPVDPVDPPPVDPAEPPVADRMPETPEQPDPVPQGVSVRMTTDTEGNSASRIAEYLRENASGGPWQGGAGRTYSHPVGLATWATPPTLRMVQGATAEFRAFIERGVHAINAWLPRSRRIRIGADAPPLTAAQIEMLEADGGYISDGRPYLANIPEGEIWVTSVAHGQLEVIANVNRQGEQVHDPSDQRTEVLRSLRARLWIRSDLVGHAAAPSVLYHEFVHLMGLPAHLSDDFPDSVIANNGAVWDPSTTTLPRIDGEAILAAYTLLEPGTEPEDISASSLDSWSTEWVSLSGELATAGGTLSFGVRHGNGLSVPWTEGRPPSEYLADDLALSDTATWKGELLGFTPSVRPVRGNAEISVNMASMDGTAGFTELQSWASGQAPGQIGTGVQWGDGDLNYSITVGGNFLRSTGGDDGTVNGRFVAEHHGVVGLLERSDLTAAFGVSR